MTSLAWMKDANCLDANPFLFFSTDGDEIAAAKRICGRCPVTSECLQYAEDRNIREGIYGGLTDRQRSRRHNRHNVGGRPASGREKRRTDKSVGKAATNTDTPTPADGPTTSPPDSDTAAAAGSRGAPSAGTPNHTGGGR